MLAGSSAPRWIKAEAQGTHLPTADCRIDPPIAVSRALVTHGQADPARGGAQRSMGNGRNTGDCRAAVWQTPRRRRQSGLALRFPRISRIRRDKPAVEADDLATLRKMIDAGAKI